MKYGSLDSLVAKLNEREEEKKAAFLVSAQQKAQQSYQEILNEGTLRLEQRKSRFKKQLEAKKKQEMTRISMTEQLRVNEYKQTLIDQELAKCLTYFEELPDSLYLERLEDFLRRYEEKPVIIVGPSRLELVEKHFKQTYDIELKKDLRIGFILSYENFDINQDMTQFMSYKKQELTKQMMAYLFEDGSHEEN